MTPKKEDRFEMLKDKRPWDDITKDSGFWAKFWSNRAGTPEQNNIVRFREAARG